MPVNHIDPYGLYKIVIRDCPNDMIDGSSNLYTADVGIYNDDDYNLTNPIYFMQNVASTYPNPGFKPISPGIYGYTNRFGHHGPKGQREKRVKALNLVNPFFKNILPLNGSKEDWVSVYRTVDTKLTEDGISSRENINIHKGYYYERGSEGCITIHPDSWNDFINRFFQENNNPNIEKTDFLDGNYYDLNEGEVIILRDKDCKDPKTCDPIKQKK